MMAWLSRATSNDEMVDQLIEYDLVRSDFITDAFRAVDRKFFVPEESQEQAYFDCPIKEGNVHLSAPHMYCSVLENLDLKPSSKLSFLNIGSGSGYLSCLVGQILGPNSTSFGVEIKPDVLQHAKNSVLRIKNESDEGLKIPEINLFQGNGLHISLKGESFLGYDRIYVGAAIEVQHLGSVNKLLAPGGIMIVPVDYSLIKVMRPKIDASSSIFEFEVLSSVHFAEVIHSPVVEVTIPSIPWSPSIHKTYPNDFQDCLRTILLCSRCFNSSFHRKNTNYSTILPKELWLHIFTFMNKRWFENRIETKANPSTALKRCQDPSESMSDKIEASFNSMEDNFSVTMDESDEDLTTTNEPNTDSEMIRKVSM